MAIDENGMGTTMLVSPANNGGGFGSMGGDGWWIILLFILLGGWGNGFGGFNGGGADIYPWMNQSNQINGGFRDQMLGTQLNGIQGSITGGFGDVQTALCGGFAGVTAALNNGFAQSEIAANARQMADMQQTFGIQSQLAQCCCDNKTATMQTQTVVQNEGAATRAAIQAQTQAILDKMCEQEIETLRAQNVSLQNQVNMLNLSASQTAQTAALVADNTQQTQYLINRIAPYPVPSYTVANPLTPAT